MSVPATPGSYIKLVQHLIEKCLLFYMDEDECINALANHATINPLITRTVWRELEKVNEEFFANYYKELQCNRRKLKNREANLPQLLDGSGIVDQQEDSCSSCCCSSSSSS